MRHDSGVEIFPAALGSRENRRRLRHGEGEDVASFTLGNIIDMFEDIECVFYGDTHCNVTAIVSHIYTRRKLCSERRGLLCPDQNYSPVVFLRKHLTNNQRQRNLSMEETQTGHKRDKKKRKTYALCENDL